MKHKHRILFFFVSLAALLVLFCAAASASESKVVPNPGMYASFWALVPPIVAIVLALFTKEVYSSLFAGILVGGLFYSDFSFEKTVSHVFDHGFLKVLSDPDNVGILIFLVILGIIVSLMNRAGGSAAFGRFAGSKIKTRAGAQLATIALGVLIFIDDYFNCLTVGSVMRPVTDKHQISRAKLAYLIDSTAAPVCIIAPISSWAAAVTGFVEGEDGFSLFIQAIPYNFYALFTILMMVILSITNIDYGPMAKHEKNAVENGDLFTTPGRPYANIEGASHIGRGTVIDLVLPIACLIACCVIGMIYTGGFFNGTDFVTAFSNSNASRGLAMGSFFGLVCTILFYVARKVLRFEECMSCVPDGFKSMVPAILILTCAWTLKSMTDSLGAANYVASVMSGCADSLMNLLPAFIFLVGCGLAFATGTSWGTFGILIPIVVNVFADTNPTLMVISISACMAGAVCGDHCSPISDTTIMASAGSQCEHVSHVSTQLLYALTVAAVSFLTYIAAGFTQSAWISLPLGVLLIIAVLLTLRLIKSITRP
ncbi:MAG: Na+/H+ antiporter NhaC family protein [Lachnospiraceae bacterium]